jgi:hypothetical protein
MTGVRVEYRPRKKAIMNLNRIVLLALAAQVGAIGTAGCKSSTTADAPATEGSADEAAAAADPVQQEADPSVVTDVGPTAATDPLPEPPAAKVEEQGAAPSDHHTWLAGYWWWDLGQKSYQWSPGYWQDRTLEATVAPPEALYEDPGRGPSSDYTYMPGYWNWRGSEYVWFHGYWGPHRDGYAYMHPYWENVNGHWGNSGWGWEHYDAGWDTRHVGWEFHGGIWERPADFRVRVTVALGHAGDFRVTPGTWQGHVYGRASVDVHGKVVGGGPNVHPGDKITEPKSAAGHVRIGGPVDPGKGTHAGAGQPGHAGEPTHAGAGQPGHAGEPAHTHPIETKPAEPERRGEPGRPTETKAAEAEHKAPEAKPAEHKPEPKAETHTPVHTAPAPEHKAEPVRRAEPAKAPVKKH